MTAAFLQHLSQSFARQDEIQDNGIDILPFSEACSCFGELVSQPLMLSGHVKDTDHFNILQELPSDLNLKRDLGFAKHLHWITFCVCSAWQVASRWGYY